MPRIYTSIHLNTDDPQPKFDLSEEINSGGPYRVLRIGTNVGAEATIFLTTAQALQLVAAITDQLDRETEAIREAV